MLSRLGIRYERYRIFEFRVGAGLPAAAPGRVRIAPLVDARVLEDSEAEEIRALASYAGPEALGFGAFVEGRVVAACWYWFGERYRTRGFIELPPRAAKLVQVTTAADWRRRGLAAALIAESARLMGTHGFDLLYARVWHSHTASASAFAKAGWRECEVKTTLRFPMLKRSWQFSTRRAPPDSAAVRVARVKGTML
jgi:GNAT superfamily N-acetyltransferase